MSPSPQLAPVGSSTYNSPTMFVGDGTWDTSRNTFLLPNLVGPNFDTMRYNGMGNRFANMPLYFQRVEAHGILAAITFLLIVPSAIMINRFYYRNPRSAIRVHIWLQIVTVLLTTVIFILGYIVVGPQRNLTNPHHGIGTAIYILILIQFIGGAWVNSRERRKRRVYIPLKAVLHQWLGRIIALLGLIQIPLGLTLYGSPLWMFVMYTLVAFALVVIYFVLQYRHERHHGREYGSDYNYADGSRSVADGREKRGGLGTAVKAGIAGLGLAAIASRFRNRSRDRRDPEVIGSRRHSGSYVEEEKYSRSDGSSSRPDRWRDRLLSIGILAGAAYWITRLLGSKKERDDDSRDSEYSDESLDRVERIEEGLPPVRSQNALNQTPVLPVGPPGPLNMNPPPGAPVAHLNAPGTRPPYRRPSLSSMSDSSYLEGEAPAKRGTGLRNAVLGLGAVGLTRNIFKKRRERKEQRRVDALREQELEDERIQRANSQRYTGDGRPRRHRRNGSLSDGTDFTDSRSRRDGPLPPPIPPGIIATGATAGTVSHARDRQHNTLGASNPALSTVVPGQPLPPPPPIHGQSAVHDSSGSEAYISSGGKEHRRRRSGMDPAIAGLAGGAAGLMAGEALAGRRDRSRDKRHSHSAGESSMASPPISVKVKMHGDGRHVTLRRLPHEEAAAERAARRHSRDGSGHRRRTGSGSSFNGNDPVVGGERWRRTEALEAQQEREMERTRLQASQAQLHQGSLSVPFPPPPPIPSSSPLGMPPGNGTGSVGSPGTYEGTTTEASADYASNRRRRRAERSQAKAARDGRAGGGRQEVDFT